MSCPFGCIWIYLHFYYSVLFSNLSLHSLFTSFQTILQSPRLYRVALTEAFKPGLLFRFSSANSEQSIIHVVLFVTQPYTCSVFFSTFSYSAHRSLIILSKIKSNNISEKYYLMCHKSVDLKGSDIFPSNRTCSNETWVCKRPSISTHVSSSVPNLFNTLNCWIIIFFF